MIRSHDIRHNVGSLYLVFEFLIDKEVIQSPSHISFSCTGSVTPPAVLVLLIRMKHSKGIDISIIQELADPFPFNWQKT